MSLNRCEQRVWGERKVNLGFQRMSRGLFPPSQMRVKDFVRFSLHLADFVRPPVKVKIL